MICELFSSVSPTPTVSVNANLLVSSPNVVKGTFKAENVQLVECVSCKL